jgi:hypothetical protein
MLLTPDRMDVQLQRFLDNAASFRARAWATQNISCHKSIVKVNAFLRCHAKRHNAPWTTDSKSAERIDQVVISQRLHRCHVRLHLRWVW